MADQQVNPNDLAAAMQLVKSHQNGGAVPPVSPGQVFGAPGPVAQPGMQPPSAPIIPAGE
jgi:hypothetical protein